MKTFFILASFLMCSLLGLGAAAPFNTVTVNNKVFSLANDASEILHSDEVVFVAYPKGANGCVCMTVNDYKSGNASFVDYRATTPSADGKTWTNEAEIDVMCVEMHKGLYAFKSVKGYFSALDKIGQWESAVSANSLWKLSLANNQVSLTCPSNGKELFFVDYPEMYVFNFQNTFQAPYYIYKHTPNNKCSTPQFSLPPERYPHAIDLTISTPKENEKISYEVYKNGGSTPFLSGVSQSNSCLLSLPAGETVGDVKYDVVARVSADGFVDNLEKVTYYVCTKKFQTFTKVNSLDEIYDNDLLMFVCPELNAAMATDDITDEFKNRLGTAVEIRNNRIDIIEPESSKVAFFYAGASGKNIGAYNFNDYKYKSAGKNGFLAIGANSERALATVNSVEDPNSVTDWLIRFENGKAIVTTVSDPSFSKSIMAFATVSGSVQYSLLPREIAQSGSVIHVEIYHPSAKLSSVIAPTPDKAAPSVLAVKGGFVYKGDAAETVRVYTITGQLVKTEQCSNGDYVPLSKGLYIITTSKAAFKTLIK